MGVSVYKLALTVTNKIVSPSSSAAYRRGGSSSVRIKSKTKKRGLTRNTDTIAVVNAFWISSRHRLPILIRVASQTAILSATPIFWQRLNGKPPMWPGKRLQSVR